MTARENLEKLMDTLTKRAENASNAELVDLSIAIVNTSIELRRLPPSKEV